MKPTTAPDEVLFTVSGAVRLRLTTGPEAAAGVVDLERLPLGATVNLDVHALWPDDVEYRVPGLLVEAASQQQLHINVEGLPGPVAAWVHRLRRAAQAPPAAAVRRLRAIPGGVGCD